MKKFHFLVLGFFFTSILISSCKKDDDDPVVDCNDYQWEYEGIDGPDTWVNCYPDCGGTSQSPVNITGAVVDPGLTALETHYEDVPIELINNGHTVEFDYETGSTLKLNGDDYNLLQFHFHTESEHTVDNLHYPMEVHLVHENEASGNLAVIGIFIEEGNENTFFANFFNDLPPATDDHYSSATVVNVEGLLPSNGDYFTYSGSLTTPGCFEVVTWLVLKMPVEASSTQIQQMHDIIHDNYRPVQLLNGREITVFN